MVKYVLGAICQRHSSAATSESSCCPQGAVKAFLFCHFIGKGEAIIYTRDTLEYGLTAFNGILSVPRGSASSQPGFYKNLPGVPQLSQQDRWVLVVLEVESLA